MPPLLLLCSLVLGPGRKRVSYSVLLTKIFPFPLSLYSMGVEKILLLLLLKIFLLHLTFNIILDSSVHSE